MTRKIFRSTLLVAVVVLLCSLGVVLGVLYRYFSDVQASQLRDELSLAATGTEQFGHAFLENMESDRFRLTWIDRDGTVLFDTRVEETAMENHGNREEVREALRSGTGSSFRDSLTLMERTFYEARRLQDGTVLRISASQASAMALVVDMLGPIVLIAVLATVLSALLARRMARKIVEPLNSLNLEKPMKNAVYEEISPLLLRISQQHVQIVAHMDSLRRKADEFAQIIGNMQEGLVLLDSEGTVLSINPAARQIFGLEEDCAGSSFLMLDRNQKMRDAVNDALDRGRGSARETRNGRNYRFDLSRIQSGGFTIGAVVLAFDITEEQNAEQLRREFSANVSHELKTPLQSIIGSAELLESGLVKAEDVPRFVGHIRKEASRLVNLVEDIIRLSQLDEGAEMPMEEVALLPLAEEVMATLAASAEEKQVKLMLSGRGGTVHGVRRLLYEILYNLSDNAIKYNVPGGTVQVCVEGNVLRVSDTGVGIPAEHQARVFERFYRVDKSHSKQSGGTGLGLSIVKHAAAYHNAVLTLESQPGEGTIVTVAF